MITFDLSALKRLQEDLKACTKEAKEAQKEGLQKLGDIVVDRLRTRILTGQVQPPKVIPDGKPALLDEDIYANSFMARAEEKKLDITAEGNNARTTNEELSEILEYGDRHQEARPHLRIEGAWADENGATVVGAVVGERLFRKLVQ